MNRLNGSLFLTDLTVHLVSPHLLLDRDFCCIFRRSVDKRLTMFHSWALYTYMFLTHIFLLALSVPCVRFSPVCLSWLNQSHKCGTKCQRDSIAACQVEHFMNPVSSTAANASCALLCAPRGQTLAFMQGE